MTASQVSIYIGSQLEHLSDQLALRATCDALQTVRGWAFVMANFNVSGRQIDLAVLTATTTLVIEAKCFTQPVRGGVNGPWLQHGPYGTRAVGNPYQQVLDCKNSLRSAMSKIAEISGYPNALVAIVPSVPVGSELPESDFKVTVGSTHDVSRVLAQASGALFSRSQCEELVEQLRLEMVPDAAAAIDSGLMTAHRIIDRYIDEFTAFQKTRYATLVNDRYGLEGNSVGPEEVSKLVRESAEALIVIGPSGCGKSVLAASCTLASIEHQCVPILVDANDFDGKLAALLDRELGLLNTSARLLFAACRMLGKKIIVCVDGYNECREDLRVPLTRSLRAISIKIGSGLLVTTQFELSRSDLLSTKEIVVRPPSAELKNELSGLDAERLEKYGKVLEVAQSGLEAQLIGKSASYLSAGASRFAIIDTFARMKLEDCQSDGILVLSHIAENLTNRATFSISIRELDRLVASLRIGHNVRVALRQSGLLRRRSDRISFIHELFLSAFSAEALIRSANCSAVEISAALKMPKFQRSKAFILGAIEDEEVLRKVVAATSDADLLVAGISGECGAVARSLVENRVVETLSAMVDESKNIRFSWLGAESDAVVIDSGTLRSGLSDFQTFAAAIAHGLREGRYFDFVMAACANMDRAIATAIPILQSLRKPARNVLRHDLFALAYVIGGQGALPQLSRFIHSGFFGQRAEEPSFRLAFRDAWSSATTPGQVYILLALARFADIGQELVPGVVSLLKDIRNLPYHLQLDLIGFPYFTRDLDERLRIELIDALEGLLGKLGVWMNSMIVDSLSALGALDAQIEDHIPVVEREIANALEADGSSGEQAAWSIFSCQFDHPFDSAYWNVVQGLDADRKKVLLLKACRGAIGSHLMFVGSLIRQLSEFQDPAVAPAIEPWTALPDRAHFMPQYAIEAFVVAHESLGVLRAPLPDWPAESLSPAERSLRACGTLFYWANRADIADPGQSSYTLAARMVLLQNEGQAAAGALYLTAQQIVRDEQRKTMCDVYPDLVVAVCRNALRAPKEQISYYTSAYREVAAPIVFFCLNVLGSFGTSEDLFVLRSLRNHEVYGVASFDAIQQIELRSFPRRDS